MKPDRFPRFLRNVDGTSDTDNGSTVKRGKYVSAPCVVYERVTVVLEAKRRNAEKFRNVLAGVEEEFIHVNLLRTTEGFYDTRPKRNPKMSNQQRLYQGIAG